MSLPYRRRNVRVILYMSVLDEGYTASAIAVFSVVSHVFVDFDV